MRKARQVLIIVPLIFTMLYQATPIEAKDKHHLKNYKCVENVTLTKKQKKKLDKLFDELYEHKKEIFETVEDYGMISEEQKDKHIELIEEHTEKMKKTKDKWCQDKTK
ncbi:DUF2680 domain-containing protein [Pueribacillus sp. YX66]|uniref:DUF2680 domain-containing protein n=1 Tax=Pueribacillus sp. YX66 TaxID=3229242 RepID=UPI00358D4DF7